MTKIADLRELGLPDLERREDEASTTASTVGRGAFPKDAQGSKFLDFL